MRLLFFAFFLIGWCTFSSAQCFDDRHNTSAANAWVSCELQMSPNELRGESHWIQYELEEPRSLWQMQLWNLNNPAYLSSGAKTLAIDYSLDGLSWIEWGTWELAEAEASGFYEGEAGPDLDGITAQYLLITILENYGGDCAGLSEIKVGLGDPSDVEDLIEEMNGFAVFPNPAVEFTNLNINSDYAEAAQISITDVSGRLVQTVNAQLNSGEKFIKLNLASLQNGHYLINLKSKHYDLTTELNVTKIN